MFNKFQCCARSLVVCINNAPEGRLCHRLVLALDYPRNLRLLYACLLYKEHHGCRNHHRLNHY